MAFNFCTLTFGSCIKLYDVDNLTKNFMKKYIFFHKVFITREVWPNWIILLHRRPKQIFEVALASHVPQLAELNLRNYRHEYKLYVPIIRMWRFTCNPWNTRVALKIRVYSKLNLYYLSTHTYVIFEFIYFLKFTSDTFM